MKLIIRFAIGDTQRSYIVIDKQLRKRYQISSGRQEWIIVIEYIYANETKLHPLIIFKGDDFVIN